MSSHCGTHIEFPYHHNRTGLDAGSFPLERLVGDAVLLDFRHKQAGEDVTRAELEALGGQDPPRATWCSSTSTAPGSTAPPARTTGP